MEICHPQKEITNQLMRLDQSQQADPSAVIRYFFECYHLQDLRELLWDWLLTALSSDNGTYSRGSDRSNLIFLYENLEKLAEAAYLKYGKRAKLKTRKKKRK
ncbi:hypothetical protein [Paraflavitalea pollutisoli]|uniref:hypothetical protein n=1 Tax=Paraflavitalea pollutisoli TaxID=3034143 RepID=UPI0023EADD95|nr:hypothetical protein [Paraflavitalea sp. H1-2-19X]